MKKILLTISITVVSTVVTLADEGFGQFTLHTPHKTKVIKTALASSTKSQANGTSTSIFFYTERTNTASQSTELTSQPNFEFLAYPIPVSNKLNLKYKEGSNQKISIYKADGQMVMADISLTGTDSAIDISMLGDGIYFYRVSDDNGPLHSGKFFVSK